MKRALLALCLAAAIGGPAAVLAQVGGTARPGEVASRKPPSAPSSNENGSDPNKGTGVIRGRIVLANGRPAQKASIQLTSSGPARATAADETGAYEFTDLPADTYRLSAGRPGYLVMEYGQKRAFERGDPLEVADGETLSKIDVTLPPSGAVSGHIVDENGDPVENVAVHLMQRQYFLNRHQLVDIQQAGGRATDDTGAYRIYGVPPGDYIVRASVTDRLPGSTTAYGEPVEMPAADLPGYAPTYYPGTVDEGGAELVKVGLSEDVQGVDFMLAVAPTARVSGVATDSRNQPIGVILARSQRSNTDAEPPVRALATANGGFLFENVAPGDYVLQTAGARRGDSVEADFAATSVTVDGRNVSDVRLSGTTGSTLAGSVTFEGLAEGARLPNVEIAAWPADFEKSPMSPNAIARVHVAKDGRFSLAGLQGPRRIRLFQGPPSWQLKSVRANGIDVTDDVLSFGLPRDSLSNVAIVLTQQGPVLAGNAVDDQGHPSPDYAVVAFSTDPDRWYQRSRFMGTARGKQDGTFAVTGLASGEYYVVAVSALMNAEGWGEWQDPEFLRKMEASATKVTLADGQAGSLTLRVVPR